MIFVVLVHQWEGIGFYTLLYFRISLFFFYTKILHSYKKKTDKEKLNEGTRVDYEQQQNRNLSKRY